MKGNFRFLDTVVKKTEEIYGLKPRKQQIKAIKELLKGNLIELQTGNGKTLVGVICATVKALQGSSVIITAPNDYLVKRDCEYANKLLMEFGLKAEYILSEDMNTSQKHHAKIKYIGSDTLVFSYMCGAPIDFDAFLLMDEIDFTLVESANHTLNVSSGNEALPIDVFDYKVAISIADKLKPEISTGQVKVKEQYALEANADYFIYGDRSEIILTESGLRSISNCLKSYIVKEENWKILDLIKTYLDVKHTLEVGKDYVIVNDKIVRVGNETGRREMNSTFDFVINTFLELMNGLPVSEKPIVTKGISYQIFYNKFSNLTGMSGTLGSYYRDFNKIYSKNIKKIKAFTPSKLLDRGCTIKRTQLEKYEYAAQLVQENPGRLILIICNKDKEVESTIAALHGIPERAIMFLSNQNIDDEVDILDRFKTSKNGVLVSTHILGRGVDIIVDDEVDRIGGIFLISMNLLKHNATERQIAGRVARNGQKGELITLISLEDDIYKIVYEQTRKKIISMDLGRRNNQRIIFSYIQKAKKRKEEEDFEARLDRFLLDNDLDKKMNEELLEYEGLTRLNMLHTLYFFFSVYYDDLRVIYHNYSLQDPYAATLFAQEYTELTQKILLEARMFMKENKGFVEG